MSLNIFFRRLWQQRGSFDVQIKLLYVLHLAMTCLTWLQLAVWQDNGSNNFIIFKNSFFHLSNHLPLYTPFPEEYSDLFQYHPVFAILFVPFTFLPTPIDLFIWLFGSTLLFLWTITHIGLDKKRVVWVMLLLVFELSKNILYAQTNIIATTGMVAAFILFERQNNRNAVIVSVFNFCIKGFGGITGLLALLYPNSRRSIGQGIFFAFLMSITPLVFLSPFELMQHYADWLSLLTGDVISESYSLVNFLTQTVGFPKTIEPYVLLFGVLMLLIYLSMLSLQKNTLTTERRAYFLAFLLLWVVVFNRASESATYIMASTGLLIWYFFHKQNNTTTRRMTVFFVICFYFTTIICTDLAFPFLKRWDKIYYFRPLFGLLPMLWMITDEYRFFSRKFYNV